MARRAATENVNEFGVRIMQLNEKHTCSEFEGDGIAKERTVG